MVAPDSFKGSLSSAQFCRIAVRALHAVDPSLDVQTCPLADGGEGTVDALITAWHGSLRHYTVTGPLQQPVRAGLGFSPDGRSAVIEMAAASGLPLVPTDQRQPLLATSFGTGELIAHALDAGAEHIILGLGGSATNDGGAGLLEALGFHLHNAYGRPISLGAAGLHELVAVTRGRAHPRLAHVRITVASDVTNPLLGPLGATAVYGPQKGATPHTLPELEAGLARLADMIDAAPDAAFCGAAHAGLLDLRHHPGAGAAGGTGYALLSLLGAHLTSGFELVAELTGFTSRLRTERFDWLVTGEGRIDAQTHHGKFLSRLGLLAAAARTPVLAFTGWLDGTTAGVAPQGIDHLIPIVPGPCSLPDAMAQAEANLAAAIQRTIKLILAAAPRADTRPP